MYNNTLTPVDDGAEPQRMVGVLLDEKVRRVKAMAAARDAALVERRERKRWRQG